MKMCEALYGFSVMAEDELFEVNGGYYVDGSGPTPVTPITKIK